MAKLIMMSVTARVGAPHCGPFAQPNHLRDSCQTGQKTFLFREAFLTFCLIIKEIADIDFSSLTCHIKVLNVIEECWPCHFCIRCKKITILCDLFNQYSPRNRCFRLLLKFQSRELLLANVKRSANSWRPWVVVEFDE